MSRDSKGKHDKKSGQRSQKQSKGKTAQRADSVPGSAPDSVDEASRESFPASDPPAWNSGASDAERESSE